MLKEKYCIGTWNVRSMKQGKLEVIKQEMARVNIEHFRNQWTKMEKWVNLTWMTIVSTTVARILWKKWSSHHSQQKSLKCSMWMQSQKWQNDLCSFPRQTILYHSNPSLCPDHRLEEWTHLKRPWCWKDWGQEEKGMTEDEMVGWHHQLNGHGFGWTPGVSDGQTWFYEDRQDLLEVTPKRDVLFIIGHWNTKVGSQETPGVTGKFGLGILNEAGQRLKELFQENALVIANTLFYQHKRRLYIWTSPDGQYWNQIDYILCSHRWRSSIQSAKTRLGADWGSDHELLIAKFRLKLKKVGKTTRPFGYDLNQPLMIIQWKWEIDSRD